MHDTQNDNRMEPKKPLFFVVLFYFAHVSFQFSIPLSFFLSLNLKNSFSFLFFSFFSRIQALVVPARWSPRLASHIVDLVLPIKCSMLSRENRHVPLSTVFFSCVKSFIREALLSPVTAIPFTRFVIAQSPCFLSLVCSSLHLLFYFPFFVRQFSRFFFHSDSERSNYSGLSLRYFCWPSPVLG